jgi:hypothetical protein
MFSCQIVDIIIFIYVTVVIFIVVYIISIIIIFISIIVISVRLWWRRILIIDKFIASFHLIIKITKICLENDVFPKNNTVLLWFKWISASTLLIYIHHINIHINITVTVITIIIIVTITIIIIIIFIIIVIVAVAWMLSWILFPYFIKLLNLLRICNWHICN